MSDKNGKTRTFDPRGAGVREVIVIDVEGHPTAGTVERLVGATSVGATDRVEALGLVLETGPGRLRTSRIRRAHRYLGSLPGSETVTEVEGIVVNFVDFAPRTRSGVLARTRDRVARLLERLRLRA